jgi:hypothetical protein
VGAGGAGPSWPVMHLQLTFARPELQAAVRVHASWCTHRWLTCTRAAEAHGKQPACCLAGASMEHDLSGMQHCAMQVATACWAAGQAPVGVQRTASRSLWQRGGAAPSGSSRTAPLRSAGLAARPGGCVRMMTGTPGTWRCRSRWVEEQQLATPALAGSSVAGGMYSSARHA